MELGRSHVVSKLDTEGMAERMDAIRLKQLLARETLTDQELMCLQIEEAGFGCGRCSAQRVAVRTVLDG
jgi:hypothetical protein